MKSRRLSRAEWLLLVTLLTLAAVGVVALRAASRAAFNAFFSWPLGGVWSNLVASLVLGAPALYAVLRKLTKNHAEHLRLLQSHHDEHLALLHEQHAALVKEIRAR